MEMEINVINNDILTKLYLKTSATAVDHQHLQKEVTD